MRVNYLTVNIVKSSNTGLFGCSDSLAIKSVQGVERTDMKFWVVLLLFSFVIFTPTEVKAKLLAYDGFDYEPTGVDIRGQSGGFGFTSPWRAGGFNAGMNANYDVGPASLEVAGLLASGNRLVTNSVSSIAGLTRDLAEPIGTAGTTRYLSFLLRPEGRLGQGAFNGFFGVLLEQPGEPEIFAGKPGGGQLDRYVLENRGGSAQVATDAITEIDTTALIVLKSEFTNDADTFTLFVNPKSGNSEPAIGDAVRFANLGVIGGLTVYSTGAFSLDEIRLGETFLDVVPVPEPASLLLLIGCLTLLNFGRTAKRSHDWFASCGGDHSVT